MGNRASSNPQQGKTVRQALAEWIEALLGSLAAAIVFVLPYVIERISGLKGTFADNFISDKSVGSGLSFGLLFVGILLTLSRRSIEAKIATHLTQISELAKVVDLSGNARYDEFKRLSSLYSQITNAYFTGVKHELIDQLRFRLAPMATEGTSPPLPASVYTKEEHAALLAARGTKLRVRAIATLFEGDFDLKPTAEEQAFVEANKKLVKSGGDFERLFVVKASEYADAVARPSVLDHCGDKPEIPGRIVFVETLRQVDPELDRAVGDGFLLFGDAVVFVDTPSEDRFVRGTIVVDPARLVQFHRLYDRLRAYSYSIDSTTHPLTGEPLAQ